MHRFYWLIDGAIAGCSLPGGSRSPGPQTDGSEHSEAMTSDLSQLRREGIGAILSLTEDPLPADILVREQFENLHLPVPDMAAPTPDQLCAALDFIDISRSRGLGVAVHCLMGQGRTGTILAAYLIRSGVPVTDAIARLRSVCPGALSIPPQESALAAFHERRDWML
jgi:atypical dual specificity phosphatase